MKKSILLSAILSTAIAAGVALAPAAYADDMKKELDEEGRCPRIR